MSASSFRLGRIVAVAAVGCCLAAAAPETAAAPQAPPADAFDAELGGPDFNADGYADVAIGTPWQDIAGMSGAGEVAVVYGSDGELGDGKSERWDQTMEGIAGEPDLFGRFGSALVTGDFDADGYDDLVLGSAGANLNYGIVQVLYGSAGGLKVRDPDQWFTPGRDGLPPPTGQDLMGSSLAAADYDSDGYDDLAMGVPFRTVRRLREGSVFVLSGGARGLSTKNALVFDEATMGNEPVSDDRFGAELAAGDLDGNGHPELVVGVPEERGVGGSVFVIPATADGLLPADGREWTEDTFDLPGQAEYEDRFGAALATGDINADGLADLAIGAPGDRARGDHPGRVFVSLGSADLAPSAVTRWNQGIGVEVRAENNDGSGASVALADFNDDGYDDLAFGSPTDNLRTDGERLRAAGTANVVYGSGDGLTGTGSQLFSEESTGIDDQAEKDDHFGSPLASLDLTNDGTTDLLIDAPWEGEPKLLYVGAVFLLPGSSSGLSTADSEKLQQGDHGILGTPGEYEFFGESMASSPGQGRPAPAQASYGFRSELTTTS